VYWAIWFAAVNLFVMGYEEPTLRRRFGESYERYTREVRRWLPRLRVAIVALLLPGILRGQDPALGSWHGYWARGGDTLLITMSMQPGDAPNHYRASFSADRLRVAGIPFNSAEREGCCVIRLTLRGDATTLVFEGTLTGDSITGTFTEAGAAGTFALGRAPSGSSAIREEEVQFSNGAVRLSGTLILPSTAPPYPAVVMVHGSGAEGRWANRFLARRFAQAGVAALIFDKRGVGQSSGDWQSAGFEDLAADAASGVAMLRGRSDIRVRSIGLFGHSQGATILPLVAEASGGVAFLIASAASGVATDSAERFSLRNAVGYAALAPAEAAQANRYVEAVVAVAYWGQERSQLDSLAGALAQKPWFFVLPAPGSSYWAFSRRIAGYDPRSQWMKVHAPVLLMYGSADQRVPAEASIQAIRASLAAAHREPPTVCVYAGADHTERVRRPGDVWPRNAAGYLEDMVTWVRLAARVARSVERGVGHLSGACT
jgi:alpha-beta hydrolase superfamily lysophospholipase